MHKYVNSKHKSQYTRKHNFYFSINQVITLISHWYTYNCWSLSEGCRWIWVFLNAWEESAAI